LETSFWVVRNLVSSSFFYMVIFLLFLEVNHLVILAFFCVVILPFLLASGSIFFLVYKATSSFQILATSFS